MHWESALEPLMAKEPQVIKDVNVELEMGEKYSSSTKLYHDTTLAKAM